MFQTVGGVVDQTIGKWKSARLVVSKTRSCPFSRFAKRFWEHPESGENTFLLIRSLQMEINDLTLGLASNYFIRSLEKTSEKSFRTK